MSAHRSQFTTIRCDECQWDDCNPRGCWKCNGTGRVVVRRKVAEKPSWRAVLVVALAGVIVACGFVLLAYWRN